MTQVTVSPVTDFAALEDRWRGLEARANGSFFQGWTWTGCLAEERFTDPLLVEAREAGRTVALALFNRRRSRLRGDTLFLGESGARAFDCIYIEHNGVLAEAGREQELSTACLRAAHCMARGWRRNRLMLSGVDDVTAAVARCVAAVVSAGRTRPALFVDLVRLRQERVDYLDRRSANTRQQIRRSDRAYGSLTVRRARNAAEAHAMLDVMVPLHQATWTARGQPGCFAEPFFGRFHHALIDRGMARNEIDMLRVEAGTGVVGILYNFRYRGRSAAYQSGFVYDMANPRMKPGLTCHHQAIRYSLENGIDYYDFLAGDDRYKHSLADQGIRLHWLTADSAWSPAMWSGPAQTVTAQLRRFRS